MCKVFPDLDRGIEWCENQILKMIPCQPSSSYSLTRQLQTLFGSAEQAEKFISYLQPLQVPKGEFIFRQGELPDGIYFVESGQVSVLQKIATSQVKRLQSFDGGMICGEISFYTQERHSASAVTDRNSSIYYLCPEGLIKMEIENPQLAIAWQKFIIGLLAERLKYREDEWQKLL
jgi:SulP family sulfate permease